MTKADRAHSTSSRGTSLAQGPRCLVVMLSMHTSALAQPGSGDAGGMNVYVANMARALRALGHRVVIYTRATEPVTDPQAGALPAGRLLPGTEDVAEISVPAGPRQPIAKEALSEYVEEFAQAVHAHLSGPVSHLPGFDEDILVYSHYWLSGLAGRSLVARLRDEHQAVRITHAHCMHTIAAVKNHGEAHAWQDASGQRSHPEPSAREAGETQIVAAADILTANTATEAEELVTYCGADPDKIQIITPGVDHRIYTEHGPRWWPSTAEDSPESGFRILFAGRFQPHKGPQILLHALAQVQADLDRQRSPQTGLLDVIFTGAPSGAVAQHLPELADRLGVSDVVRFIPPVEPTKLAAMMRTADLVVMPSVTESFGLVAAEAQACGTGVLAHRAGGLSTVVDHGRTGELLEDLNPDTWATALKQALAQPQVWENYGRAAVAHAQGFSWQTSAQRVMQFVADRRNAAISSSGSSR
ncbi:glycosyltransferase [Auritidibacter ignavus]|uniref:glycosyltransferase n=1 Tax=Auritidibacter ignavus TaxID=678932 RepID=UPI000F0243A5|nr:glycosyltransferase [Auritidibacter ignavus]NIH70647.1 D-inositol-3-phosphate glycosyltransferase [Auritidibacter ignavus]RMX23223.1 glycosyltransferase [Auritidibacter ignavus]